MFDTSLALLGLQWFALVLLCFHNISPMYTSIPSLSVSVDMYCIVHCHCKAHLLCFCSSPFLINDLQIIHLELTSCDRRWSSFPLTIDCHDSHRVACVSVQSPHYHTALIGRHLTGRQQCAHSLPLSSLSPPPATSGGCDHHTVCDVSPGLHKGQRTPADPYCSVIDTSDIHATWGRRCCGD